MSENKKPLKSVLSKKKGIQEKHVDIAGNNDFSSITNSVKKPAKKKVKTSTQRLNSSTLESVKILYFFLSKKSDKPNPTFDDILNYLMDDYVDSVLNTRQKEMFKQMIKSAKG